MDAINVSIRHEQFEQVNNLIIELGLILLRHYEHETAMMDALDYPNITEHTNEHIRLHNRINEISREVIRSYDSVEAKQYVNTTAASDIESIIFNHMTQHDLKLALWITKNKPDLY
jgi:hemerythrin-like metal-binding protein